MADFSKRAQEQIKRAVQRSERHPTNLGTPRRKKRGASGGLSLTGEFNHPCRAELTGVASNSKSTITRDDGFPNNFDVDGGIVVSDTVAPVYTRTPFQQQGAQAGLLTPDGLLAICLDKGLKFQWQHWATLVPPSTFALGSTDFKMLQDTDFSCRNESSITDGENHTMWAVPAKGSLFLMQGFSCLWMLWASFKWLTQDPESFNTDVADGHQHAFSLRPQALAQIGIAQDFTAGGSLSAAWGTSPSNLHASVPMTGDAGYLNQPFTASSWGILPAPYDIGDPSPQYTRLDLIVYTVIFPDGGTSEIVVQDARLALVPINPSTTQFEHWIHDPWVGPDGDDGNPTYQWYGDVTEPGEFLSDGTAKP